MEDDDSENVFNLERFFTSEDYVEKTFNFGALSQRLLCSNMSSTDYDLTGQIVWPASVVLGWFVYNNQQIFEEKNVIELGAGCGLGGFVASNYSRKVIVTDGNEIVVSLLEKNQQHLETQNVDTRKLLWGIKVEVENLYGLLRNDVNNDVTSENLPDVVIGADVVLWPREILGLLVTIRWLLSYKPRESLCFISYIVRANSTTDLLFSTATSVGLAIELVDVNSFIPVDNPLLVQDSSRKMLLRIKIAEEVSVTGIVESQTHVDELIASFASKLSSVTQPC